MSKNMNVRKCSQIAHKIPSILATLMSITLITSACKPGLVTLRPPKQNELLAFCKDHNITLITDKLLDNSAVLLYDQGASFGYYTLTVRESTGALVELDHLSVAKSDQPILTTCQLTGDQPFIAVIIQDSRLLAETTAIEISNDSDNRLTATLNGQAGAIMTSPWAINGWRTIVLYNAQGEILYSQEY